MVAAAVGSEVEDAQELVRRSHGDDVDAVRVQHLQVDQHDDDEAVVDVELFDRVTDEGQLVLDAHVVGVVETPQRQQVVVGRFGVERRQCHKQTLR